MKSAADLMDLPFDIFTRNSLIGKLVDSIKKNDKNTLRILDVGGRAGNLSDFLKDDELHILDIRTGEESNYVLGDVTNSPYRDDSFDVVISSDAYEHIPKNKRLDAIAEMLRISKNFIILGAPFDSKYVREAEIKACNYFNEIAGEPHPWLKEHINNGLPSSDDLEYFLGGNGFDFLALRTNNISNWLLMQLFMFYSSKYGVPNEDMGKVYRYYNDNLLSLGDSLSPTYRMTYLIGKKGTLPKVYLKSNSTMDLSKYHTLQELIFVTIGRLMNSKDLHIQNLEMLINGNNEHISKLTAIVQSQDSQIHDFEMLINGNNEHISKLTTIVQSRDSQIHDFEMLINGNNEHISKLTTIVQSQDSQIHDFEMLINGNNEHISKLTAIVQSRDSQIRDFENVIVESNMKLNDIYHSTTWNMLKKYQQMIDILLPYTTKRRHVYDLGIISIRIIVNDGFSAFLYKLKDRGRGSALDVSKIALIQTNPNPPFAPLALVKGLRGKFTFPTNNLIEVRILTATYKRRNSDLELHITNTEGQIIRKASVKGYKIQDNKHTSFKFKPIKDNEGQIFFFKLTSKGEPSAAVWYNESVTFPELSLIYDDAPINGSIGFQAFANIGIKNKYNLWILKNEPTQVKLEQYKKEINSFTYHPKISIVTPVFNVDQIWLEKAIDSVRNQLYENWELCIVDDASTKKHIKQTLEKYSKKDGRIKVKYLSKNKGISGASNEALSLATGEFLGLLDNDDELSIDALYEVVKLLNKNPEIDLIYSDEDKITENGTRCNPFFKPDWSLDLLLSVNYICHFTVIRKNLVEEVGQFNLGFEGAQDYDLFLRITEKTNSVEHIPKILYHWRMLPGSTALDVNVKSDAHTNGIKALQNHLKRENIDGRVIGGLNKTNYRIEYSIDNDPLVSIIIPFKDKSDYLKKCISSIIKKTNKTRYEIILVSNNSKETATFEYLNSIKEFPNITIIKYDSVFNFSAINNFAAKKAAGEYLLFLNNDTEVITDDWLNYLLMHAQREKIGCVGAKLLYPDGTIQHAGVVLGMKGMAGHVFSGLHENQSTSFGLDSWTRNYLAVTGACLMISKDKFKQVGGYDEKFIICGSDVDLCIRVHKMGCQNLYVPYVRLYHFESVSRGTDIPINDFQKSWSSYQHFLQNGDQFFNPNLSLENTLCDLNIFDKWNFEINYSEIKETLLKMDCNINK